MPSIVKSMSAISCGLLADTEVTVRFGACLHRNRIALQSPAPSRNTESNRGDPGAAARAPGIASHGQRNGRGSELTILSLAGLSFHDGPPQMRRVGRVGEQVQRLFPGVELVQRHD